jgi:8-oxo-dGTP pyrophosphatase MutT (NUDIX family)
VVPVAKPKPWQVLEERRLYECRVFDVHEIEARSPRTGDDHTFYGIQAPSWVNVVPVTAEGQVVMVHQYRHGARDVTLETPGGMVDAGESAAVAGARELLEETGYAARELVDLGSINPNPALFGNALHAFLAPGARKVADVENDSTEETVVTLVPITELRERVAAGEIDHVLVVAVIYLAELRGLLPGRR